MERNLVKTSKFLSLVLRHNPGVIGITLDSSGWVDIDVLLAACAEHRRPLDRELLDAVVRDNNKQRFAVSEDGRRIRASQGHSVAVELEYEPLEPPETLYHGTARQRVQPIMREGLSKMQRHHVHLSADRGTAVTVGARYGVPVVLQVASGQMHRDGYRFFRSANGVWLTDHVPSAYLAEELAGRRPV